jgi:hypothetical protein
MDDDLDERVGARDRSRFIGSAGRQVLEQETRVDALEAALGSSPDTGHEWDNDPPSGSASSASIASQADPCPASSLSTPSAAADRTHAPQSQRPLLTPRTSP